MRRLWHWIQWRRAQKFDPDTEDDKVTYTWPVPWWRRILFLPRDLFWLHLDLVRSTAFFFVHSARKTPTCYFCNDPANLGDGEARRCSPATHYANLGVARSICPCMKPPAAGICDIPYCASPQRSFATFRRILLAGLVILGLWAGIGLGLYSNDTTRAYVGDIVKRRTPMVTTVKEREYNPDKGVKKLAQAKKLMEEKRWGEARIAALNARAYDPKNVEIRRTLAELYILLRQVPLALSELEECFKLDPTQLDTFLDFATIAIASRNHQLVLPHIESAPPEIANTPRFKVMHALVMFHEKDQDRARELAMELLDEEQAETRELLTAASLMLFQLTSPQGGLRLLEKAIAQSPEDEQVMILLARAHRMNNNYEEANKWVTRVEQSGSINPQMMIERAEQHVHAHQLQQAIERFEYLAGRNSALTLARARLAELYLATDQIQKAKAIADDLVELQQFAPYGQGHTVLAQIAMRNRFYSDAIEHIEQAMKVLGETYQLLVLKAKAHLAKEEYKLASEAIAKATDINPDKVDGLLTHAAIHLHQGATDEARELLLHAGKQEQIYTYQWMQLGELAVRVGAYQEARIAYLNVLHTQPDNLLVLNRLIDVMDDQGQDVEVTRSLIEQLAERLPDNLNVAQTLGRIILRQNNLAEDINLLEESVAKFPFSAILHAHLGTAYHRLGRNADAKTHLQEALSRARRFGGRDVVQQLLASIKTDTPLEEDSDQ